MEGQDGTSHRVPPVFIRELQPDSNTNQKICEPSNSIIEKKQKLTEVPCLKEGILVFSLGSWDLSEKRGRQDATAAVDATLGVVAHLNV